MLRIVVPSYKHMFIYLSVRPRVLPASFVPSLRDSSHDLIRPGTPVPGYSLFRPSGTGFVRVSSFSNLSKAADKDDVAKVVPSYKRMFIYLSVRPRVFPASFVPSLRDSSHGIIRPGAPVPGYRLFRPCGTGFVGVFSFSNLSKAADKDDVANRRALVQTDVYLPICRAPSFSGKLCAGVVSWHNSTRHHRAGLQVVPSLRDWLR